MLMRAVVVGSALLGCGSHSARGTRPEPNASAKIAMNPVLHGGDSFAFHVDVAIDEGPLGGKIEHAGLHLDDQVEVVSPTRTVLEDHNRRRR